MNLGQNESAVQQCNLNSFIYFYEFTVNWKSAKDAWQIHW